MLTKIETLELNNKFPKCLYLFIYLQYNLILKFIRLLLKNSEFMYSVYSFSGY